MAGFRSVAFWLGLSSEPVTTQGGFLTPMPGWNAGGGGGGVQGGFVTPLPFWRAGAGEAIPIFTPEPVHPPGMRSRRSQIMEEDESILAVIIAFLEMKNR